MCLIVPIACAAFAGRYAYSLELREDADRAGLGAWLLEEWGGRMGTAFDVEVEPYRVFIDDPMDLLTLTQEFPGAFAVAYEARSYTQAAMPNVVPMMRRR